jgi:hypothetical protein
MKPTRQRLAARVGIGIGIGIGIENSQGRTGPDPDAPRQPRALPIRGPRPGGPPEDSPARESWVPSSNGIPALAGRQKPLPVPPPARNSFPSRGWKTLHHGFPGCVWRRCSNARPRLGSREEVTGHPSTAAGSGPTDSPTHPDHSKWNCASNAMDGCPGPSTETYECLPLTRHAHVCAPPAWKDSSRPLRSRRKDTKTGME